MRFFNTEGPNRPEDHYTIAPLQRWDLAAVLTFIDQKKLAARPGGAFR